MRQRTLIMLKPDSVQRGLMGDILARFEHKGFKVVGLKMIQLTDELLESHYAHMADKPFFPRMAKFMKSAPVVVLVLEADNAVELARILSGTAPDQMGTIRGDYTLALKDYDMEKTRGYYNIIHSSETPDEAVEEIKRFFDDSELFTYAKTSWQHIYGDTL